MSGSKPFESCQVVEFLPDGSAVCLYTDALPLADLGRLTMERASNVEWDETDQVWTATLENVLFGGVLVIEGREIARHADRGEVIKMEKDYFNSERLRK